MVSKGYHELTIGNYPLEWDVMQVDGKKALQVLDQANDAKAKGSIESALSLYKEYLSMVDPSFTHGVWLSMAEILFQTNQLQEALVHCDKGLEIMKDFLPCLELKKEILSSMERVEEVKKVEIVINRLQQEEKAKWDDPNHYYHYQ
ncbi:hypothetical protein LEP1GSC202_3466 [Leptospira yanagawae serovar Saopaulo str. Sao Paulo = ATCC 700523]|uniref:Tetratricopeptide repeat protein n=1 Tax=Leptospira yanagawae serovar Saopaulo str. Sao Paulo = ATCC 700523 TaxID=1249483 RepID=A0A5E8HDD4_9LEPT|nr:hypothetical protein LEP1GSC202_3466 [Leptospira yanagawae serovar Saopaulo str. Sao Paulo = ATCC 700523]